jgi:urease accessory protein
VFVAECAKDGQIRTLGAVIALIGVLAAAPALGHTAGTLAPGLWGGLAHPLFGVDHVVAMVAVGLWGAFLGAPAVWLLPIVFPLVMAAGGVLGILGLPLPGVEIGIAVSAVVLGLSVALALRPPLWVAAILVGAFAIFHGHAHGAELPSGVDATAYAIGFVAATGFLHVCGIAFGLLARWPAGRLAVRAAGAGIALAGIVFLSGRTWSL